MPGFFFSINLKFQPISYPNISTLKERSNQFKLSKAVCNNLTFSNPSGKEDFHLFGYYVHSLSFYTSLDIKHSAFSILHEDNYRKVGRTDEVNKDVFFFFLLWKLQFNKRS